MNFLSGSKLKRESWVAGSAHEGGATVLVTARRVGSAWTCSNGNDADWVHTCGSRPRAHDLGPRRRGNAFDYGAQRGEQKEKENVQSWKQSRVRTLNKITRGLLRNLQHGSNHFYVLAGCKDLSSAVLTDFVHFSIHTTDYTVEVRKTKHASNISAVALEHNPSPGRLFHL